MTWIDDVRGVLLDVDGTLLSADRAIPGAAATLVALRTAGIPFRVTTNTTRRPRSAIAKTLRAAGLDVEAEAILTPAALARRRIVESGRTSAALLVAAAAVEDFHGVEPAREAPDWVVVGDLADGFTWEVINRAFRWLRGGAGFLALQKNRFWTPGDEGEVIDAGPFVAALEYASGVEAEVVGKPSPDFFAIALADLGLPASQVMVVGDDVTSDGRGARAAGCRFAIVRTGKFTEADLASEGWCPDLVLDSVAALEPPR